MTRKLASIRIIKDLLPIEGADRIELAVVDGWRVIVKKGEFEVGQKCIYCEIDSFLPEKEEYEFLRKSSFKTHNDGTKGFRLRSIKLRGVISQGLLLPYTTGEVGDDLTESLGIKLFEAPVPACLQGDVRGMFPGFIKKTDEERCLSEDSIINTNIGNMTIKDICSNNSNMSVLSYNHDTEEVEYQPVISRSVMRNNKDWLLIETESGRFLRCTPNHRIWCDNLQCYRLASDLDGSEIIKLFS